MTGPSWSGDIEETVHAYQREWFVYPEDADELPAGTRLHVGFTAIGGRPVTFLVQLERWDGRTWCEVARFDHDADGPAYRDVERSGLHLDLYDPTGEQVEKVAHWRPQASNEAMGKAEDFFTRERRVLRKEVREVALGEDVPDVDEFDRDDLRLSPEMHRAQAIMAAERGEAYDPLEFERRLDEVPDPDPIEDAVPVDPDE